MKKRMSEKVVAMPQVRQMWVFLVTLPNGDKFVDSSTNKTPKEKLYTYYGQIQRDKHNAFLDAIRTQCDGRTDNLDIRILDFGQSNVQQLAKQWLDSHVEMWIERLESDNMNKGGLNID